MAVSLASAVVGDISTAVGLAYGTGIDLTGLQAALAAPGAMTRGTAPFMSAQTGLIGAASSIADSTSAADATLTSNRLAAATSAQEGVEALSSATDASSQLASLTSSGAFVRRAATNHANASS